ncbi:DEAD/DEAH box helicase [Neobacillus terrae]|uniref:DEAD/DEAH box helicase n=1 Tax=Neobacillus terrae TaxID=3034837 RepID=UPI00140B948C|nr:DEAD/DEAH box helicase [Neobacillus terrae]NHM31616.1 DEAD/DEAH box helicase [Neobacillus terrae]
MTDFLSLGISQAYANLLKANGIAVPTPIQERAIPPIMEGKDVIAQAQTGTGKTFAFVLPILEKLIPEAHHVQALIVTPTRELALQITSEINKFIEEREDIRVLAVYGGQDVEKQLKKLKKGPQIVVGTPGRMLDHIRRGTVQLSRVSFLVLDEADQMLHIGFLNEVEEIIKETPRSRQSMLFSATMPDEIKNLAGRHMRSPENIQIQKKQAPALSVNQLAIHSTDRAKQAVLMKLIETHRPFLAVIFCRTKRRVSKLYEVLRANGYQCDELHGDLSQAKREQVMERFRKAEIQLLIATDVAARGLDVEGVTHVFNYDIPQDTESYIHRIGRTGRAGQKGLAITLYSAKDKEALYSIEKDLNITIKKENSEQSVSPEDKNGDERVDRGRKESRPRPSGKSRGDRSHKPQREGGRGAAPNRGTGNSRRNEESRTSKERPFSKERDSFRSNEGRNRPSGRGASTSSGFGSGRERMDERGSKPARRTDDRVRKDEENKPSRFKTERPFSRSNEGRNQRPGKRDSEGIGTGRERLEDRDVKRGRKPEPDKKFGTRPGKPGRPAAKKTRNSISENRGKRK